MAVLRSSINLDFLSYRVQRLTGQHAGIFAGAIRNSKDDVIGFTIVEQYSGLDSVVSRTVYFDPVGAGKKDTYFYRGGDYATVTW
jgi:hypothetical protein